VADLLPIPVENGTAELIISLSWTNQGLIDTGLIRLRDPLDNIISPFQSESRHRVWRVTNPMGGEWTLSLVTQIPGEAPEQGGEFLPPYLVQAAVESDVTMDLYLTTPVEDRVPGVPMGIVTSLTDAAPITGATVLAGVTAPNGTPYLFLLFDDGLHEDGAANDGIYGNTFYNTGQPGSYNVNVIAGGTSPINGSFVRQQITSFHLNGDVDGDGEDDDSDGDGLPDAWEIYFFGTIDLYDATDDPDNDGSDNGDEHQNGTDPTNDDTDGDGEADGTDDDPLNPGDGNIDPIWGVAYPGDSEVYVHFVLRPEYQFVGFFRGDNIDGPFLYHEQLVFPTSNVYTDTLGVINGNLYCYIIAAIDTSGNRTANSAPTCATPNGDYHAPHGYIFINDGAAFTHNNDVMLTLWATDTYDPEDTEAGPALPAGGDETGVTEMMISNRADMVGGVWEAYATSKPWTLNPPATNLATVFVKYRDGDGNESSVYPASIHTGMKLYLPFVTRAN
jgi:hypothetical protein